MSSPEEKKCNQCLELFNTNKKALRMPGCQHNICEQCLQQIRQAKLDVIQCQFCNASAVKIQGKKFQLNRVLMSRVRESKNMLVEKSSQTSVSINAEQQDQMDGNQFLLTEEDISAQQVAESSTKKDGSICKQHEKPFEIVCVTDLKMICPHCAIFGNHKDHVFKTLKQFNNDYEHRYEKLQIVKQQKYIHDKKFKGIKENSNILAAIDNRKAQIRSQIKGIFEKLKKQLQNLQVSICQELNRSFSAVYKDITILFDKENKIDQQYSKWESQCQNLLDQIDKNQSINSKIQTLYGPLAKVTQGQELVEKLEKKTQLQTKKMNNLINSVNVQLKEGLELSKFVKVVRKQDDPKKDNFVQMLQKLTIPSGKHVLEDLDFNENSFLCDYQKEQESFISQSSGLKRTPSRSVMTKRSPQSKVPSTSQKFKSPNKKISQKKIGNDSLLINRCKSNTSIKMNQLLQNTSSPNLFQTSMMKIQSRDCDSVVSDFIKHDLKQVLDLSRCELDDKMLLANLKQVRRHRKIRGIKICQNYITDAGFQSIIQFLGSTSNMNLSYNKLTQQTLSTIIKHRDKLSPLRIINLSFNNINEKKGKARIEALKKMGIIVNI